MTVRLALLLAGLGSLVLCAPAEAQEVAERPALELVRELLKHHEELGEETALERLSGLRSAGIEPIVALLLGEADAPVPNYAQRQFLLGSLDQLPRAELLRALVERAHSEVSLDGALGLMEVLSAVEHASALEPLIELHEALSSETRQQSLVGRGFRSALGGLLDSAPASFEDLGALAFAPERSWSLGRDTLQALRGSDNAAAVSVVERALVVRPELAWDCLATLASLHLLGPSPDADSARELVRRRLDDSDDSISAAALSALGALGEFGDIPALIERLDVEASVVSRAASGALQRLTGIAIEQDSRAWFDWFEREQVWLNDRLDALRNDLLNGDVAHANAARQELLRHPWHRDRTAMVLAGAAGIHGRTFATSTCALLGDLGGPAAIAGLVEVLRDGRQPVRSAAHRALVAATGKDLEPDYYTWRERISGTR